MKKVLLAQELKDHLVRKGSVLDRADVKIFSAATNEELLRVYMKEEPDLVVTLLDLPGIRTEDIFKIIRHSKALQEVSTIIICKNTLVHQQRAKQCGANVVYTKPVKPAQLFDKIHQFLNVAPRKAYRASVAVAISGQFKNKPLSFWTENISVSGMLMKAEEPLTEGDAIFFSFFLADGKHVSGYGEIVRSSPDPATAGLFQYGVRFTKIDGETRAALLSAAGK